MKTSRGRNSDIKMSAASFKEAFFFSSPIPCFHLLQLVGAKMVDINSFCSSATLLYIPLEYHNNRDFSFSAIKKRPKVCKLTDESFRQRVPEVIL